MSGPLAGLRIFDLTRILAGPTCTQLLGDLGADVIKIERPGEGDDTRRWGPPYVKNEDGSNSDASAYYLSSNRNKRSLTIDIAAPEGQELARRMVASCDIVVENFRAGTLDRLKLGYEDLKALNPRLVYCSITGYGQRGPYARKGAFDVTVQAMSGLMSVTGEEGRPPVKCGVPVGDFCAGLYAAYTITAALMRARETGEGAFIDCSMLGSLIGIAALQTSEHFGTGGGGRRLGSAHPRNAPYQAFKARDDYFVIAAGNDALWRQVAEAVDLPSLVEDPRFLTQLDRARNQEELAAILEEKFAARTAAEWLEEMDRRGVPSAPINNYADVLSDPQVKAMGLVRDLQLPNGARTRTTAFPIGISGFEFDIWRDPPELGADNEAVFREWGTSSPARRAHRQLAEAQDDVE